MKRVPVFSGGLYRRLAAIPVFNGRLQALKLKHNPDAQPAGTIKIKLENEKDAAGKIGVSEMKDEVFGRKLGLVTRLIGCSHPDLSRPFVEGKTAYRSCLKCGARRQFNLDTFETFGRFYSAPIRRP